MRNLPNKFNANYIIFYNGMSEGEYMSLPNRCNCRQIHICYNNELECWYAMNGVILLLNEISTNFDIKNYKYPRVIIHCNDKNIKREIRKRLKSYEKFYIINGNRYAE